jgi:hypothetical protein
VLLIFYSYTSFQRRSPFRPAARGGNRFRNSRFRRSRSDSRGRYDYKDRRRRSRSNSPKRIDNTYSQQAMPQMYNDGYNYMAANASAAPSFTGQFNSYEFQAYSQNPAFAACPVPPGMTNWQPMQPEESEEEKQKREGNNYAIYYKIA